MILFGYKGGSMSTLLYEEMKERFYSWEEIDYAMSKMRQ